MEKGNHRVISIVPPLSAFGGERRSGGEVLFE
jgi:hypothetical protein